MSAVKGEVQAVNRKLLRQIFLFFIIFFFHNLFLFIAVCADCAPRRNLSQNGGRGIENS